MSVKHIRELFDGILSILSFSDRFRATPYEVDVIVNPSAGKVAHQHTLHREMDVVREFISKLKGIHPRQAGHEIFSALNARLHISEHPGYVGRIVREVISTMRGQRSGDGLKVAARRLLVSVGGDGTHEELLSVLYEADAEVLDRLEIFRLPMGTGNDAADAAEVADACELLYRGENGTKLGAIRVKPVGMEPFYSFNIASFGIDAYVTDMTNRLKNVIPGDVYKVIADVATLFYEPRYRHSLMTITGELPDGTRETFAGKFLLVAIGLSGHRVYGGAKPVLPGDENLCMMTKVGIARKVFLKKMLYTGTHVFQPETTMRSVRRIWVQYDGTIPVQVDGESRWLRAENFPVEVEILEPRIRVLTLPAVTESRRSSPAGQIRQTPLI